MHGRAISSFVLNIPGDELAIVGVVILATIMTGIAYAFGPAEYFALYLLAFCTLGGVTSTNQAKSDLAACLSLGLAMFSLDSATGMLGCAGDSSHLMERVDFLVAISETFLFIQSKGKAAAIGTKLGKIRNPLADLKLSFKAVLRGTGISSIARGLPGARASLDRHDQHRCPCRGRAGCSRACHRG